MTIDEMDFSDLEPTEKVRVFHFQDGTYIIGILHEECGDGVGFVLLYPLEIFPGEDGWRVANYAGGFHEGPVQFFYTSLISSFVPNKDLISAYVRTYKDEQKTKKKVIQ